MGKFRSKLKRTSTGKRWRKGQSSVSNPETKKFRDAAKSRLFTGYTGTTQDSSLTVDALQKHNAVQSYINPSKSQEEAMEDVESSVSAGTATSYKTMQSFASEWSSCSNMSYARFLKVFRSDSALHKEMLAILAALTEVIKQSGGTESSTEYYCALLTTLEEIYNDADRKEEQVVAVLSLINMGIKTVPEGVLRKCFGDTSQKMLHILKDYASSDNNTVIKSLLEILSVLLKNQDLASWSNSSTVDIFNAILQPFCIHSKPKIRKCAQQAATYVITSLHQDNMPNVPADKVAEFCVNVLENRLSVNSNTETAVQASQTTILHILGLMKDTICYYPKAQIKKCCETVLRLISLNSPLVTSCGMQVLHSLFSAQFAVVSGKLNAQLIAALYEYQPSVNDVQPTQAWLLVMEQAHVHLADVDMDISCSVLPKFFTTLTQLWLSDKPEIMSGTTRTMEAVLKDAIAPVCATKENVEKYKSKLSKCFNTIELGLGYQYHNCWHQVLHIVGVMFEAAGPNCSSLLLGVLKSLAELRDSYKFSYNSELEHAVGAAIRSMGPETVLSVISLKKDNGDLNIDRSWLLPVLKENIKGSTLNYFITGILPLATYCQSRAAKLAQANDGIGAHSSELLYMQLWNLLPCFCNHPTDIHAGFKSIAKVLGTAISSRKELRLSVMASLRKLITSARESDNPQDLQEITRFDKNYLPILFNVYTTKPMGSDEEGHRLAALDTIKMFLSIARPELSNQLFNNALERLNAPSEDPEDSFIKESILDLIRVLVPFQNTENITTLYQQCIKTLPEIKNSKEQKKAYRLLEEICSTQSEACKEFIKRNRKDVQSLLRKSLEAVVVSSKGARLRCLNHLIKVQPQLDHTSRLIRFAIPEAVMSCKDVNERTRTVAYEMLNTIMETLMKHDETQEFLNMLVAGLAGTTQLTSCTVLAFASLMHHFSCLLGNENIKMLLENVSLLCTSPTREVVASCLSLLKVYIASFPSPMVAAELPTIMKAMTNMNEDCKRHFRLKLRDILDRLVRKYGHESLTPHIPANDTVMYKRLRNLRKLNARKKRKKDELKNKEQEDDFDEEFIVKNKPKSMEDILADSDSDFEDMETDQPKVNRNKKQISTWIQEDPDSIVDFTDPTVASKITATRPGLAPVQFVDKKKSSRGFKTASDGRLIIADDNSDSDSDRRKDSDADSDSDEDGQSIAETLKLSERKRKRSNVSLKSGISGISTTNSKYKAGGSGIHRPLGPSTSSVHSGHKGSEYKSKKAAGDVKKKGRLDPYAYLPLQRSALNKRKKLKAAGQFKNIVKAAKSGALKGAKAKKKSKK